jgi:hypothetical protein
MTHRAEITWVFEHKTISKGGAPSCVFGGRKRAMHQRVATTARKNTSQRACFVLALLVGTISCTLFKVQTASGVPSDVIDGIENDIVTRICSDGGEWLTCYNKSPSQCRKLSHEIVRPCLDEQLKDTPMQAPLPLALKYVVESKSCFNRALPTVVGPPIDNYICTQTRPAHLW